MLKSTRSSCSVSASLPLSLPFVAAIALRNYDWTAFFLKYATGRRLFSSLSCFCRFYGPMQFHLIWSFGYILGCCNDTSHFKSLLFNRIIIEMAPRQNVKRISGPIHFSLSKSKIERIAHCAQQVRDYFIQLKTQKKRHFKNIHSDVCSLRDDYNMHIKHRDRFRKVSRRSWRMIEVHSFLLIRRQRVKINKRNYNKAGSVSRMVSLKVTSCLIKL